VRRLVRPRVTFTARAFASFSGSLDGRIVEAFGGRAATLASRFASTFRPLRPASACRLSSFRRRPLCPQSRLIRLPSLSSPSSLEVPHRSCACLAARIFDEKSEKGRKGRLEKVTLQPRDPATRGRRLRNARPALTPPRECKASALGCAFGPGHRRPSRSKAGASSEGSRTRGSKVEAHLETIRSRFPCSRDRISRRSGS